MCSAFSRDCGNEIAVLISLGTCFVQKQCIQANFACTKTLFILLAEPFINVRNAPLCARCAILFLKIKQHPSSLRLAKGFTFLKRVQNQFKMLVQMSFVRASIV